MARASAHTDEIGDVEIASSRRFVPEGHDPQQNKIQSDQEGQATKGLPCRPTSGPARSTRSVLATRTATDRAGQIGDVLADRRRGDSESPEKQPSRKHGKQKSGNSTLQPEGDVQDDELDDPHRPHDVSAGNETPPSGVRRPVAQRGLDKPTTA